MVGGMCCAIPRGNQHSCIIPVFLDIPLDILLHPCSVCSDTPFVFCRPSISSACIHCGNIFMKGQHIKKKKKKKVETINPQK